MTVAGYGIWFTVLSRNPMSQVMPVLLFSYIYNRVQYVVARRKNRPRLVLGGGLIVLSGVAIIVFAHKLRFRRVEKGKLNNMATPSATIQTGEVHVWL
ncbi:MAG: hypothetical protein CM1200mP18_14550 [Gammaproteobacteria bacterium]|nr:MAG: hypothetical protein CM1200mP18_14550 [Gammaproteobacteria bacterium]